MTYSIFLQLANENKNNLFKVISGNSTSPINFNKNHSLNYSPKTLLDDEQCFKIDCFSKTEYCLPYLKKFSSANYNQWDKNKIDIKYFLCTNGDDFFFQQFSPSTLIDKCWFILSEEPILSNKKIITLNDNADAYYNKKEDILYFHNLAKIKKIFKGIEILYRKATNQEVMTFFQNNIFCIDQNFTVNEVGSMNRRRIALIKNTPFNKNFIKTLQYYYSDIQIKNKQIIIKNNVDLKHVLYHLDEKFYTTENSQEKRLANSVIKLE